MRLNNYAVWFALIWPISSQATILSTQTPLPYACENCERLSHDTLTTHWSIASNRLEPAKPQQQISKKYAFTTTYKKLTTGVVLHTQAPGAVIRIHPKLLSPYQPNTTATFKPEWYIKSDQSSLLPLNAASSSITENNSLNDAYFTDNNQIILQLKPSLGAGKITLLATPSPEHDNDQYTIHVFDKGAKTYLAIQTNKTTYHYGDIIQATIALQDDLAHYPVDSITATLIDPEGKRTPLSVKQNDALRYITRIPLKSDKTTPGQNWYIETTTTANLGGELIKRQAHTAFSYAIPSAVVTEIKPKTSAPLTITATLNVATGSRYALQAVLFKLDSQGEKIPLEIAQSAAWFAPGNHDLILNFSTINEEPANTSLYINQIQLIDYGQLKPVFEYNHFIHITPTSSLALSR